MTEQFASAHGKLFSGDRQCIENLKHGYATLLSIYDMHCSHYFLRNLVEWPKLGHMIQLMYEAEKVTGQEKYDPNWQRISDHMVQVFSCLSGHENTTDRNIFSLTGNSKSSN